MRALKWFTDFATWRWAPTVGLIGATLFYILLVLLVVPGEVGLPGLDAKFVPRGGGLRGGVNAATSVTGGGLDLANRTGSDLAGAPVTEHASPAPTDARRERGAAAPRVLTAARARRRRRLLPLRRRRWSTSSHLRLLHPKPHPCLLRPPKPRHRQLPRRRRPQRPSRCPSSATSRNRPRLNSERLRALARDRASCHLARHRVRSRRSVAR